MPAKSLNNATGCSRTSHEKPCWSWYAGPEHGCTWLSLSLALQDHFSEQRERDWDTHTHTETIRVLKPELPTAKPLSRQPASSTASATSALTEGWQNNHLNNMVELLTQCWNSSSFQLGACWNGSDHPTGVLLERFIQPTAGLLEWLVHPTGRLLQHLIAAHRANPALSRNVTSPKHSY